MKISQVLVLSLVAVMIVGLSGITALPVIQPDTDPYHSAHAAVLGTITASSSTISRNQTLQISVSDADIAGVDAGMPSVTLTSSAPGIGLQWSNYTTVTGTGPTSDGAFFSQGSALGLYQATGGTWVGFVTINSTGSAPLPINNPPQDGTGPGDAAGATTNFVNNPNVAYIQEPGIASGAVVGKTGGRGTGASDVGQNGGPAVPLGLFVFNLTTTRTSGDLTIRVGTDGSGSLTTDSRAFVLGDTVTFTYNDVSPAQAVSTTVTVSDNTAEVSFNQGS